MSEHAQSLHQLKLTSEVPTDDTETVAEQDWDRFERLYLKVENDRLFSNVFDGLCYNLSVLRMAIVERRKRSRARR